MKTPLETDLDALLALIRAAEAEWDNPYAGPRIHNENTARIETARATFIARYGHAKPSKGGS